MLDERTGTRLPRWTTAPPDPSPELSIFAQPSRLEVEQRVAGSPAGGSHSRAQYHSTTAGKGHALHEVQPLARGARIRLAGGKITVTDGPFAETKEVVGDYALIEAKTRADAVTLATRFMELHRIHWPEFEGESEIRPLEGPA